MRFITAWNAKHLVHINDNALFDVVLTLDCDRLAFIGRCITFSPVWNLVRKVLFL